MSAHDELDAGESARLRDAIARLPQEIDPAHDLWPEIRTRIEAGRVHVLPATGGHAGGVARRESDTASRSPRRWLATPRQLVAAAAVLVVVSATATWFAVRRPDRVADDAAAALAAFASYEQSATELSAALDRRSAVLDSRTRAVLERSLRTIDGAIAEAREALAADPTSPAIRAFVAAAYRQKIDFLRRANDVAVVQGS